jgi:4,5-dihydroxyphthalate decarboxylase
MSKLNLTLACLDYDRVKPLMLKVVEPAGIDLNFLTYSADYSVWPMIRHQEFDASEMTLASYAVLRAAGEAPYIAIPVFLARTFVHGGLFVHARAGINQPRDLEGKRVASGQFLMSFAVWVRGLLQQEYGVDLTKVDWRTGRAEAPLDLPPELRFRLLTDEKTLVQRLEDREIDALIAPRVPPALKQGPSNIRRLFPNPKGLERDYYRRTKVFPILHLIAIKNEIYERHPWVASSFYRAFVKARDVCYRDLSETLEGVRYTVPWLDAAMDEVQETMGADFWPYGLKSNRHTLETYLQYLQQQHLMKRPLKPEELFAANALD